MTRILAAALVFLLAAVGWVLLRPRWRWETVDKLEPGYAAHVWGTPTTGVATGGNIPWRSVTSSASNGRSATLSSIDDAARWAGG